MTRLLRVVLMLLLVVLGGVAVAAAWIVGSEPGSRWALQQVMARLPDGVAVAAARIDGRLLDRLTLHELHVEAAGTRIEVLRLHLDWRPIGLLLGRLRLVNIELDRPVVAIGPADGEPSEPWQGTSLPIRIDVGRLAITDAGIETGSDRFAIPTAGLRGRWQADRLRLDELAVDIRRGDDLQLQLDVDGQLRLLPVLPLDLALNWQSVVPEVGNARGSGTLRGDLARLDIVHRIDAPLALTVNGSVALADTPRVDLLLDWEQLQWPPVGDDVMLSLAAGELALVGSPEDYRLRLDSLITAPALAVGALKLSAQGDTNGLQPVDIDWGVLGGKVAASAALAWAGVPGVNAAVDFRGIEPSRWQPDLTGSLDGRLVTELQFNDDGANGTVTIERLSGRLAEQPVAGSARVTLAGRQARIESLVVDNGRNRINMRGVVGDTLALQGQARIAGLDQYLTGASGSIEADWSLAGSVDDPRLKASLNGAGLGWGEHGLATATAEVTWPGLSSSEPMQLQLALADLRSGAMALDDVRLDAVGVIGRHRIALQLSGPQLALTAAATGGLSGDNWQGVLEQLQLEPVVVPGPWTLRDAVPVVAGAAAARLRSPLCLQRDAASVCTEFDWSRADGLTLASEATDIPLRTLAPLLPPEWQLDGQARIALQAVGQESLSASVDLAIPGATLATPLGADTPLRLEDIAVRGRMAPDRKLLVEAALGIVGHGALNARIAAAPESDTTRYRLDGNVGGQLDDLSALAAVTDAVALRGGRLDIDLGIAGDSTRPTVTGGAQLTGLLAGVPALGTEFTDITTAIRTSGTNRIAFDGGMAAGDGRVTFDGALALDEAAGYPLQIAVRGSDALVARLPEAEVTVSPDLAVRTSARQGVEVRGELLIPRARIEIEQLPADVAKVSADQQLVGAEDEPGPEAEDGRVDIEARIRLGDEVRLSGFGLETRLTGAITLRDKPQSAPQGFGEIALVEGSYRAYGQDLNIDTGRLIFAGPVEDPGINLKAFRRSNDQQVKAWLAVTGQASAPSLRVYAEPEMAETEALAYLLTGKGLAQSGGADQSRIYAAALNWGVGQGEPLLTRLQDELGLSTLAFEGGEAIEDSGVQIGKYLSPDLYLGYGLGLFGRSSELLLRYHVNDYITVESRSGDTQSADVFYQIERD